MGSLIVDADVFIDMLRDYTPAVEFFEKHPLQLALSVVTLAELLAGFKTSREEKRIFGVTAYFEKFSITENIAVEAGYLRNRYGKSHGTGLIDCIVAATATVENATLVTLNKKHYPMLKNVLVPYKKN